MHRGIAQSYLALKTSVPSLSSPKFPTEPQSMHGGGQWQFGAAAQGTLVQCIYSAHQRIGQEQAGGGSKMQDTSGPA